MKLIVSILLTIYLQYHKKHFIDMDHYNDTIYTKNLLSLTFAYPHNILLLKNTLKFNFNLISGSLKHLFQKDRIIPPSAIESIAFMSSTPIFNSIFSCLEFIFNQK